MSLTIDMLNKIAGNNRAQARRRGFVALVNKYSDTLESISKKHRLAMFLAQIMAESAGFRNVEENLNYSVAGLLKTFGKYFKTRAQAEAYARQPKKIANRVYANRMENGDEASGDGWKFRGRDGIQLTGRKNTRLFTAWARANIPGAPDFVKRPERMLEPEYLGLASIYYWSTHVPLKFIDTGNHEMVRRRVNGGLNGYEHTLRYFDRAACVMLGFDPDSRDEIRSFQNGKGLAADGIIGPVTRSALHSELRLRSAMEMVRPPVSNEASPEPLKKQDVATDFPTAVAKFMRQPDDPGVETHALEQKPRSGKPARTEPKPAREPRRSLTGLLRSLFTR